MNKSILKFNRLAALPLLSVALLSSCKKDKMPVIDPQPVSTKGVYVLCEGSYGSLNNSSITYYDVASKQVDKDYFKTKNGIVLGTDATELKQYGSKMYVVVTGDKDTNNDAYIEVINIATGKSLKRIPFSDNGNDFHPRHIAFYKNKAYVSSYDGYISKVDTASLSIEARIAVGGALEGVAIVNNKLYVANSAHTYFPNANNSSVSVVDLNTFTKKLDIPVSFNPAKVAAAANGEVFVITMGVYGDDNLKPSFDRINSITDTKTQSTSIDLASISITGNTGLLITGYPAALKYFNISTGVIGSDFITDATPVTYFYGATVDPLNGDVYVADSPSFSGDGNVLCFAANGKKKFEFSTGTAPQSAVFNYNYN